MSFITLPVTANIKCLIESTHSPLSGTDSDALQKLKGNSAVKQVKTTTTTSKRERFGSSLIFRLMSDSARPLKLVKPAFLLHFEPKKSVHDVYSDISEVLSLVFSCR